MTTEDCIKIPPVEEWPEGANGIVYRFTNVSGDDLKKVWDKWVLKYIPRPVPRWKPQVGDMVFATQFAKGLCVLIGKVVEVLHEEPGGYRVAQGENVFHADQVKPFNPDHIGKSWEEICPF